MGAILLEILKKIWGNKLFLVPVVASLSFGSAWFVKGIIEEFECANEARVAALQIELDNEKTISANNEALRQAADKDIAGLKIEVQRRKERANALIEQFKDSGCDFTDDELGRLQSVGGAKN